MVVYVKRCILEKKKGTAAGKGCRIGTGTSSRPRGTVDQECCADDPFKGLGVHK